MQRKKATYCRIKSCENNRGTTNPDVIFFRSPLENLTKWNEAIQTLYGPSNLNGRTCHLHFTPDDFIIKKGRATLKSNAIPSVPLPLRLPLPLPTPPITEIKLESVIDDSTHNDGDGNAFTYIDVSAIKTEVQPTTDDVDTSSYDNAPANCVQCHVYKDQIEQIADRCIELEGENKRFRAQIEYYKKKYNIKDEIDEDCQESEIEVICEYSTSSSEIPEMVELNDVRIEEQEETHLDSEHKSMPPIDDENSILLKMFKCGLCELSFAQPKELASHMSQKHFKKKVESSNDTHRSSKAVSNVPPVKTRGFDEIRRATKSDFDVSPLNKLFACVICDESFSRCEELKLHRTEKHLSKKSYECYICKQTQKNITTLRLHMRQHNKGKRCLICDEHVSSVVDRFHLCSETNSISCDYCSESFGAMSKLLQHLEVVHVNRTMYQCRKCPEFFGMKLLRKLHEKNHKDISKSFICDICSRGFSQKCLLEMHINRMHGAGSEESHLCSVCGKQFKNQRSLTEHMLVQHDNSKEACTFPCPKCPSKFTMKKYLTRHLHTHSTQKFKCNECSKEFTTKFAHVSHIRRVHLGIPIAKNYQCTLCPLKFKDRDKLGTHSRTHTGEKPYACDVCPDKKYAYSGDLMKHMQTVHDFMYTCDECGQKFKYVKDLKRHIAEHYESRQGKERT